MEQKIKKERLEQELIDALRKSWDKLGYYAEIIITKRIDASLKNDEIEFYHELMDTLDNSEFWRQIHSLSMENEIEDSIGFERVLRNIIAEFTNRQTTQLYIDKIDFSFVHRGGNDVKKELLKGFERINEKIEKIEEDVLNNHHNIVEVQSKIRKLDDKFSKEFFKLKAIDHKVTELSKNLNEKTDQLIDKLTTENSVTMINIEDLFLEKTKKLKEIIPNNNMIYIPDNMWYVLALLRTEEIRDIIGHVFQELENKMKAVDLENKATYGSKLKRVKQEKLIEYIDTDIGAFVFLKRHAIDKYRLISIELNEEYQKKAPMCKVLAGQSKVNQIYLKESISNQFRYMIRSAKKELYIMSPWANEYVFNIYKEEFLNAMNRGVKISIAYGYEYVGSQSRSGGNIDSEIRTEETIEEYKKLALNVATKKNINTINQYLHLKKGDSHIKGVITDENLMMIGSCNLLSYAPGEQEKSTFKNYRYDHGEIMMTTIDKEAICEVIRHCF